MSVAVMAKVTDSGAVQVYNNKGVMVCNVSSPSGGKAEHAYVNGIYLIIETASGKTATYEIHQQGEGFSLELESVR